MKLIVGLGNPGQKYNNTRHNTGFMAVDALAHEHDLSWQASKKLNAQLAKGSGFIFLKPQTFMNDSGRAVAAALNYFQLTPAEITVIHDDLDINLGKYKISADSRSAGHRGVQSIIDWLKTKNFKRLRIGVKTPILEKIPADKFVLQKFTPEENNIINLIISQIKKEQL